MGLWRGSGVEREFWFLVIHEQVKDRLFLIEMCCKIFIPCKYQMRWGVFRGNVLLFFDYDLKIPQQYAFVK